MTTIFRLGLAVALVLPAGIPAHAADDAAYCRALVDKYETYVIKTAGRGPNTGATDGSVAAAQCKQGDPAGIPVLEQKLRAAKIDLPPRG